MEFARGGWFDQEVGVRGFVSRRGWTWLGGCDTGQCNEDGASRL